MNKSNSMLQMLTKAVCNQCRVMQCSRYCRKGRIMINSRRRSRRAASRRQTWPNAGSSGWGCARRERGRHAGATMPEERLFFSSSEKPIAELPVFRV